MLRRCFVFLLLAACSGPPQSDLQYIKQARSLAAEWALVNEQAADHRVTPTYAASLHRWLSDGLRTAARSLSEPNSPYGREIRALQAEPADAPSQALRAHADALKQIEDQLESV